MRLIVSTFVACSAIAWSDRPTAFPGKQSLLRSPDRQCELINRDVENDTDAAKLGGNHTLIIRCAKNGAERKILTYDRHVEAFWSPDSRLIAITDFAGSDRSVCYIYQMDSDDLVNLADSLAKAFEGTGKLKNHHVYFQAVNWQRGPVLTVKVNGYGEQDKNGFESWCLYYPVRAQAVLLPSK